MVYVEAIDWMVKFFVRFTTTDNAPKSLPQFGLNNDLLANSNALWQGREQLGYITRLSRLCWYSGRLERDASETHELGSGTQQLNLYVRPQCWIFELLNKAGFSTSGAVTLHVLNVLQHGAATDMFCENISGHFDIVCILECCWQLLFNLCASAFKITFTY